MPEKIEEIAGYITLSHAAVLAGYVTAGNLRTAVTRGRLQARLFGHQLVTRREWLDDYLATVRRSEHYGKGVKRKERTPRRPASEEQQP